jgi:hypothetical protein
MLWWSAVVVHCVVSSDLQACTGYCQKAIPLHREKSGSIFGVKISRVFAVWKRIGPELSYNIPSFKSGMQNLSPNKVGTYSIIPRTSRTKKLEDSANQIPSKAGRVLKLFHDLACLYVPCRCWNGERRHKKLTDAAVKKHGKDWVAVAAMVPGRTDKECRSRWTKTLDPVAVKTVRGSMEARRRRRKADQDMGKL